MIYDARQELKKVIEEMESLSYSRGQAFVSYDDVTGWVSVIKSFRQHADALIRELVSPEADQ